MKKLTLFPLILLAFQVSFGQDPGWYQQNSPVTDNLISISVIDEQHVWIAGVNGTLLYTEDGGTTWELKHTFPQQHLESIFFTNSQHGCLVGWGEEPTDSTLVMITNDGGQTWQNKEHPRANYFFDVFFINDTRGWIVGKGGVAGWIIFTDDGGESWGRQMELLGVSGELYGVYFRDNLVGQICGVGGTFLITNNAGIVGNGWAINISIPSLGKDLYGMIDYGVADGWAVGEQGLIIGTIDNWTNWYEPASGTENNLNAVHGDVTVNKFWTVGDAGTILHKAGFLVGWSSQVSGVTENLNDVGFASSDFGWAVGDNGTILKYTISGAGIGENNEVIVSIYPNPCADALRLRYLIHDIRYLICDLYSIEGKRIRELIHEVMPAGEHEVVVDMAGIPAGIYYLKLQVGNNVQLKKIVKAGL